MWHEPGGVDRETYLRIRALALWWPPLADFHIHVRPQQIVAWLHFDGVEPIEVRAPDEGIALQIIEGHVFTHCAYEETQCA